MHWEQLKQGADILDENEKVIGFEDELKWNNMNRQFYLTIDSIKNELNVNLEYVKKTRENSIVFLKEISDIIYAHIYKKKPAVLREKMEYFLNYDLRNRRILYLAMVDMVRYSFYSGGNIMSFQPGVNLNETSLIDIKKLRDERVVSAVCDSILKTNRLIDRNFIESFSLPEDINYG